MPIVPGACVMHFNHRTELGEEKGVGVEINVESIYVVPELRHFSTLMYYFKTDKINCKPSFQSFAYSTVPSDKGDFNGHY